MYHSRFKGNHFDAGYKYGNTLYTHGIRFEKVMRLTPEKISFGKQCILECEKVYPEILEEMKGIAKGLRITFEEFASFTFGIYCFPYNNWCTSIAFRDKNSIIFARNSDFLVKLEKFNDSPFYNLDNTYPFIGNTTTIVQIEDGVNIHGLAVGLTFIYPKIIKPGLNAGLLVRYFLEKCKTVNEALEHLKNLPISSSHTLTMIDKSGDMCVVESNCEETVITRPPKGQNFIAITNDFISEEMKKYKYLGLEDDVHSTERYETAQNALKNSNEYSVQFAMDLLKGKYGFMCQYDRSKGFDTVWSSIYDLKNDVIYRVEGNPSKKTFKIDTRLDRLRKRF